MYFGENEVLNMADNVYYCNNCGGIMEFDISTQTLKCPNCETQINIENDKNKIVEHTFTKRVAKTIKAVEKQSSTMQCKGCGAKVEVSSDCTATECAYCGASYVLAEKQEDAIVPDGVIPFLIDKRDIKQKYEKWINKRWLAPGKLKKFYETGKMQGIYVPYWTFDADVDCPYTAQGGKERKEKIKKSDGSVTEKIVTDWYHTSGRVKEFFDDVQIHASNNLKPSLIKGVEPFDTKSKLKSYSPEYLSGYSAECYTISLEDAHRDANEKMENELRELVRRDVMRRYDDVKDIRLAPHYKEETYKHVLVPVYSTAFTYNNKNYNVLINGETGRIKGEYPKSPFKIALIVAAIVGLIAAILLLGSSDEKENVSTDVASVYTTDYSCDNMECDMVKEENVIYDVDYIEI